MGYKLRFVQSFDKGDSGRFLEMEKKFIALEKQTGDMTCGRRYVPVMGREPTNTLIWEAEFTTMERALECLKTIEENADHEALLDEQTVYMRDAYIELYKLLE